MHGIKILSTGSYLPDICVTNDMFSEVIDTNDEWITTRTGIKTRNFVSTDTTSSMAVKAAKNAIEKSDIDIKEIGVIIVATFTPEQATPPIACILNKELELSENVIAFDMNGACSGFIYSLNTARSLLYESAGKYALVVGCETISKVTDFTDRSTCCLFGDGAGAVLIENDEQAPYYFTSGVIGSTDIIFCDAIQNSSNPFVKQEDKKRNYITMNGREVFRFAVDKICHCIETLVDQAEINTDEVDYYVCHQANYRILSSAAKRLCIDEQKFFSNLNHCGNTSAASIPIALDEMNEKGLLKRGMKIVFSGFGAGLTYGGIYLNW